MPLETRAKRREPVQAQVEYAINEATEKGIKLNIPPSSIKRLETSEVVFIKCQLLNISVIGCAIDSPYMIPPGVILDLKIDPGPFIASHVKEPMKMIARVTSCNMKAAGRYRLGVCFTKIENEDASLVDNFIKSKERRQAPRWDMRR